MVCGATSRVAVVRRFLSPADCARLVAALDALPLGFERGRQGTGYDKADLTDVSAPVVVDVVAQVRALLGEPPAIDAWWIVYPPGSHIPAHTDPSPADGLAHVRVNLIVERSVGGAFVADCRAVDVDVGDAVVFRPDVVVHAVSLVKERPRRVLSVGTVMAEDAATAILSAACRG
jgi:hypothetical protein